MLRKSILFIFYSCFVIFLSCDIDNSRPDFEPDIPIFVPTEGYPQILKNFKAEINGIYGTASNTFNGQTELPTGYFPGTFFSSGVYSYGTSHLNPLQKRLYGSYTYEGRILTLSGHDTYGANNQSEYWTNYTEGVAAKEAGNIYGRAFVRLRGTGLESNSVFLNFAFKNHLQITEKSHSYSTYYSYETLEFLSTNTLRYTEVTTYRLFYESNTTAYTFSTNVQPSGIIYINIDGYMGSRVIGAANYLGPNTIVTE